jgi:6-phosphogluconolactonase
LEYFVYIGTHTNTGSAGIYGCGFETTTGALSRIGLVAETENPSFLVVHPNGRFLYAVNEIGTFEGKSSGSVSAFAISPETGKLTLMGRVASMGAMPAYVSFDKLGRHVLVANYEGGSVAVFPIAKDGRLDAPSAFVDHAQVSRQTGELRVSHAHAIRVSNDNRFAIAADLGLDQLLTYGFDPSSGSLTSHEPKFAELLPGAGPRHLIFHPSGTFLYVVNELDSTVTVFSFEPTSGTLRSRQTISTLPESFASLNSTAEILIDQAGKVLYISNRGHDSIAVFEIDANSGILTLIEHVLSGGQTPRNFALDPSGRWLFAANQDSNNVVLFHIDQESGRLSRSAHALQVISPVCVTFAPGF